MRMGGYYMRTTGGTQEPGGSCEAYIPAAYNTCVPGTFGEGGSSFSGGGGGYYGGTANYASASGGSGYIGNPRLINMGSIKKIMYGYKVTEDTGYSTNTSSTDDFSLTADSGKAKAGDGYARVTKLIVEEE